MVQKVVVGDVKESVCRVPESAFDGETVNHAMPPCCCTVLYVLLRGDIPLLLQPSSQALCTWSSTYRLLCPAASALAGEADAAFPHT